MGIALVRRRCKLADVRPEYCRLGSLEITCCIYTEFINQLNEENSDLNHFEGGCVRSPVLPLKVRFDEKGSL